MLNGIDQVQPYEKQTLLIAMSVLQNSPYLTPDQKTRIEDRFQDIVRIYTEKDKT